MTQRRGLWVVMAVAVLVAGCATYPAEKKSLYERLGGKPAIQAVVDDFITNVAAAIHAGMKITEGAFNALVADLVKSLDKFKVPGPEQNELLTALGGMKGDIVGQ